MTVRRISQGDYIAPRYAAESYIGSAYVNWPTDLPANSTSPVLVSAVYSIADLTDAVKLGNMLSAVASGKTGLATSGVASVSGLGFTVNNIPLDDLKYFVL